MSIGVYLFLVSKELIVPSFKSPQGLALILQVIMITAGYFLISHFAKQERKEENKRIDQDAFFKEKLEKLIHNYDINPVSNRPKR